MSVLLLKEKIKSSPCFILDFKVDNLFICLWNGTYLIFNGKFSKLVVKDKLLAFSGIQLFDNEVKRYI